MDRLGPCTLVGTHVELSPVREGDRDALLRAGKGVDWSWMAAAPDTLERVES